MIKFSQKGDLSKTLTFLKKIKNTNIRNILTKYGEKGVAALSNATPRKTGLTANSWSYKIVEDGQSISLTFHNSNIQNGVPIAIILQYGHGTGTGGWVEGIDYINPAIKPIFDELSKQAWEEVTKL